MGSALLRQLCQGKEEAPSRHYQFSYIRIVPTTSGTPPCFCPAGAVFQLAVSARHLSRLETTIATTAAKPFCIGQEMSSRTRAHHPAQQLADNPAEEDRAVPPRPPGDHLISCATPVEAQFTLTTNLCPVTSPTVQKRPTSYAPEAKSPSMPATLFGPVVCIGVSPPGIVPSQAHSPVIAPKCNAWPATNSSANQLPAPLICAVLSAANAVIRRQNAAR